MSLYTLAIDKNGQAWAWGDGYYGNLGNNKKYPDAKYYVCTPIAVYGTHTFCKISAGFYCNSSGIDKNGSAWGWGLGDYGQIGNNTTTTMYSTPVAVCGNHTFCEISSGVNFTLALDNHGIAWSWGGNAYGQLGTMTTAHGESIPTAVCGNKTFCAIKADYNTSYALDNHGYLWAWGNGLRGVIGNNSVSCQSSPVAVCGGQLFNILNILMT